MEKNELLETLNKEQGKIINSQEDRIVVYAGPGSGKTYTMIQKIIKDFSDISNEKGFIVNSFTIEASKQLRFKLEEKLDKDLLHKSFIGTTDNFIVGLILKFAYLYDLNADEMCIRLDIPEYYNSSRWLEFCQKGQLILSYDAYYHVINLLNHSEVVDYIKGHYSHLYIDEVQDFNESQFLCFEKMIRLCKLKVMYVGDEKQSIYGFRGASPREFKSLKNYPTFIPNCYRGDDENKVEYLETPKFTAYEINTSLRCPDDILSQSLNHYNNWKKLKKSDNITLGVDPRTVLLDGYNNMILCHKRADCSKVEQLLSKNNDKVYYIQNPDMSVKFGAYAESVTTAIQVILYNLSPEDTDDLVTDLMNDLKKINPNVDWSFLLTINEERYEMDDDFNSTVYNFFSEAFPDVDSSKFHDWYLHRDFYNLIFTPRYKYWFDRVTLVNRVMTVHQSKGLEADNVYCINPEHVPGWQLNYSVNFVSFTRAKKKLYLFMDIDEIQI